LRRNSRSERGALFVFWELQVFLFAVASIRGKE
jgi:hypothetical protein